MPICIICTQISYHIYRHARVYIYKYVCIGLILETCLQRLPLRKRIGNWWKWDLSFILPEFFSMNNFLIFKKQKQIHDGNLFEMASFILGISMVVASSLNWHQNCQGPTPDRIRYTEWDSYIQLALGSFDQVIYILIHVGLLIRKLFISAVQNLGAYRLLMSDITISWTVFFCGLSYRYTGGWKNHARPGTCIEIRTEIH